MKLRFTPRAIDDIGAIASYIRAENPAAALRVRSAILDSLQVIAEFPAIGRRQNREGVRKHVTRKFDYLAYYVIDEGSDEVVVLSIQHPARQQP